MGMEVMSGNCKGMANGFEKQESGLHIGGHGGVTDRIICGCGTIWVINNQAV